MSKDFDRFKAERPEFMTLAQWNFNFVHDPQPQYVTIDELAGASVDSPQQKQNEVSKKNSTPLEVQRKTELIRRRHLMDTGEAPSELTVRSSANGSKLNSNRYPSISQEQPGRDLVRSSYAEQRRGPSEFEAWLAQGSKRTMKQYGSQLERTQYIVPKREAEATAPNRRKAHQSLDASPAVPKSKL